MQKLWFYWDELKMFRNSTAPYCYWHEEWESKTYINCTQYLYHNNLCNVSLCMFHIYMDCVTSQTRLRNIVLISTIQVLDPYICGTWIWSPLRLQFNTYHSSAMPYATTILTKCESPQHAGNLALRERCSQQSHWLCSIWFIHISYYWLRCPLMMARNWTLTK